MIIYTSAPRANSTPLPLAAEHRATEEILIGSGVPYTILRNGWYNENYEGAFNEARETGTIVGSAGSGKVSSAARRDYAEAAAVVATTEGHQHRAGRPPRRGLRAIESHRTSHHTDDRDSENLALATRWAVQERGYCLSCEAETPYV